MRKRALAIGLLLLAGCQDVIGLGGSCAGEMQSVRREMGSPDRTNRTQQGGDFTESWIYFEGDGGWVYTFRWGISFESCQRTGPMPLPAGDELLAA